MTSGIRLTAAGWAVAVAAPVLFAAGVGLRYAALAGIGTAGLAALVFATGHVVVRPSLSVHRGIGTNRVTVGGAASGSLRVRNLGRVRLRGFEGMDSVDGRTLPVPIPPLAAGEEHTLRYRIPAPYRGLVRLGPVVLRRIDPFGLLRRDATLAGQELLWVRPNTQRVPAPPVGIALDFEGRLTDAMPHGSTAFASLREYVAGDDPRHIHWRSTARLGELVVRDHVDTTEPSVALVLDARTGALDPVAFEHAVEVCASVAAAARAAGHNVALAATGEDRLAVAALGGVDLLDRLAAISQRPGGDAADPTALVRLADASPAGGCLVVVSGTGQTLPAALARHRRRYSRVVIVQCAQSESGAVLRRPGMTVLRAGDSTAAARALRASLGTGRQ